ncbi:MAG: fluoride efflux transporter FluC [Halobacteriales archaeon]
MLEPLLVAAGGAVGASARYAVGNALRTDARLPVSTLAVNVVGSFVLGVVAFGASDTVLALVGTGACGAFTTFSSFSYETVEALRDDTVAGAANATLNLVLSVAAVALAYLAVSV